jgi:hypothetical protein
LFRIPVESPRIKAVGNQMKFDRQLDSSLPDFEIFEAPMRPVQSPALDFFALCSSLFADGFL